MFISVSVDEVRMKTHVVDLDYRPVLHWKSMYGKRCGYLPGGQDISCYIDSLTEETSGSENKIDKRILKVPERRHDINPLKFEDITSAKKYAELREQAQCLLREKLSQGDKFKYQIQEIPKDFCLDHNWNGKIVVRKIGYDTTIWDSFGLTPTPAFTIPLGLDEIVFCDIMLEAQNYVYQCEAAKNVHFRDVH